MAKEKIVYVVAQTQTSENYNDLPIYIMSVRLWAEKYAQRLNKEYAYGVYLDNEGNFVNIKNEEMDYHFYRVIPMVLDEELAFDNEWCKEQGIGKYYVKNHKNTK